MLTLTFIGGETNQFYPDLIADNHPVEQPYLPADGYHLSKDLADQAIQMIKDQKASNPSKLWYMWLCPGANHAPHQIPRSLLEEYGTVEPPPKDGSEGGYGYDGMFDKGYEVYRDDVLDNMKGLGILPADIKLTEINPLEDATK